MKFKLCLILSLIFLSSSSSYSQNGWEMINASFQEYFAQEKYDNALKTAEEEFDYAHNNETPIYQKAFSCSDIAITLYALQRYEEAEKYMLMSVKYNLEMSGTDSDNTLSEMNKLAMNYAAMKENAKADSILRIIINTNALKHGPNSEETLDAVNTLIKMYDTLGNNNEVNKLRDLYKIPEPKNDSLGHSKKDTDSLKALEDTIKYPIANDESRYNGKVVKPIKDDPTNPGFTHTVKKGETLYAISLKYKVTINNLKSWNNLKSNVLMVGQIVKIQK